MIHTPPASNRLPPRLSMDEYADFVEASLRDCNRLHAARQKEVEERIRKPFRILGAIAKTTSATAAGES
jgi:hypothetical protein